MKAIASLASLVLALSLAGAAGAQDASQAEAPPVRGAGAGIDPDQNQTEMKANAAGSAVATGQGEVAAGQTVGTNPRRAASLPNGMDLVPATQENGRWYNAEGIPVPKIEEDGTVDFSTFNGFRRYSAECHVCHGPDGEGSTYAPALKTSVLRMDYYDFQEIVASGKQDVNTAANLVMPAFGTNKNVWCYIDDIYVYLLARGTDELPRGRPAKRADKSEEYTAQEDSCMSM